jgi:redox-sensitive bicupin YhaK (pirin superfamily)
MAPGFETTSLRGGMVPMGHVLNVDHFKMSAPTFPPHPHAGFSAVTYMLPWSRGAFVNRDSLGDRSMIAPGDLHWTLAGSGMMHEEIPVKHGVVCEGLQIFVKLREGNELAAPRAFHVNAEKFPVMNDAAGVARILVGSWRGVEASIPEQENTNLIHFSLRGEMKIDVPDGFQAFAFVLRGNGRINGSEAGPGAADSLPPGVIVLSGEEFDVLIGISDPMPMAPHFSGPFCMFDTAELTNAKRRFAAGEMGHLAPSF